MHEAYINAYYLWSLDTSRVFVFTKHQNNSHIEREKDMDAQQTCMKTLMVPWLAYGHISPFLELAKDLTTKNFHIYLCSTPINLNSIKKRITQKYSLSIELVEIHLPVLPDLPSHRHTTNGLPRHLVPTLKLAFDMSKNNFAHILDTIKPDLIIYDYNLPWVPTFAARRNIPAVEFMIIGTAICSFSLHMFKKPGVKFPFPGIRLKGFQEAEFQKVLEYTLKVENDEEGTGRMIGMMKMKFPIFMELKVL